MQVPFVACSKMTFALSRLVMIDQWQWMREKAT